MSKITSLKFGHSGYMTYRTYEECKQIKNTSLNGARSSFSYNLYKKYDLLEYKNLIPLATASWTNNFELFNILTLPILESYVVNKNQLLLRDTYSMIKGCLFLKNNFLNLPLQVYKDGYLFCSGLCVQKNKAHFSNDTILNGFKLDSLVWVDLKLENEDFDKKLLKYFGENKILYGIYIDGKNFILNNLPINRVELTPEEFYVIKETTKVPGNVKMNKDLQKQLMLDTFSKKVGLDKPLDPQLYAQELPF